MHHYLLAYGDIVTYFLPVKATVTWTSHSEIYLGGQPMQGYN